MDVLHLQALQWTDDGELCSTDRFTLLTTLMASSLLGVHFALIALMERAPMALEMVTSDVSVC